jgi:hypothetical protein
VHDARVCQSRLRGFTEVPALHQKRARTRMSVSVVEWGLLLLVVVVIAVVFLVCM